MRISDWSSDVCSSDLSEGQMQSLVKIYESMKPKDAARIFEELDMEVLLEVVERMKERKTAPILAEMNPERAKTVTRSEEHTSELQSLMRISYAVFCLKKKKQNKDNKNNNTNATKTIN